eukprot:TRINITY_DN26684_c0_g1_i1.p3 TRINITY_DN26684_c0_g1~~TRINITY_DN26684_c0_g1_i1.p3  ORF type:complete len:314 (+),score=78.52 TRINITY_DN26684_c0_g1_i1:61-942(+)
MAGLGMADVSWEFQRWQQLLAECPRRGPLSARQPQGYLLLCSEVMVCRAALYRDEWRRRGHLAARHAFGLLETLDVEAWQQRNRPFADLAVLAEEEMGRRFDLRDEQRVAWLQLTACHPQLLRDAAQRGAERRGAAHRMFGREEGHRRMRIEAREAVEREHRYPQESQGRLVAAERAAARERLEAAETGARLVLTDTRRVAVLLLARAEQSEREHKWGALLEWREHRRLSELARQEAERERISRALREAWESDLRKEREAVAASETSERWKSDRAMKEAFNTLMHLEKLHRPA